MEDSMSRKEECLENHLIINCCILRNDIYSVISEKDYGEEYDPWAEWPPTHLTVYYKYKLKKKQDPWGCMKYGKNNFKWSKIVHIGQDTILIVDNERGVETVNVMSGEAIRENEIPRGTLYTVENLKNIHGTVYAVGSSRGVARRDGKNKWTSISQEIQGDLIKNLKVLSLGFDAIDGFEADRDLYAGGGHSDMWHYDGEHWRAIDLPILKMRIRAIVCADDGNVYAVGRHGKMVVGRGDNWKVIYQKLTTSDFTDAVWYNDRLYVCTARRLYTYKDDRFEEITDFGERLPYTFGSLYVNDGMLMSAGDSSIAVYDGKAWEVLYGSVKREEEAEILIAQEMKDTIEEMVDGVEELVDAVKSIAKKK